MESSIHGPGSQEHYMQDNSMSSMATNHHEMGSKSCPFTRNQVTKDSTASRILLATILFIIDSHGTDLLSPFDEAQNCPMMRCVQKDRFHTPIELINHLRDCIEASGGEVRCESCRTCHTLKRKSHTSLVQLYRRLSGNRKHGRNASPDMAPFGKRVREERTERGTGSTSDEFQELKYPIELHSQPTPPETFFPGQEDLPSYQPVYEASGECILGELAAPEADEAQYPPHLKLKYNYITRPLESSRPTAVLQPQTKHSWSEESRNSTLCDDSPIHTLPNQPPEDLVSPQSSTSGSYNELLQLRKCQAPTPINVKNLSWLSDSEPTVSPDEVAVPISSQAPWSTQITTSHGQDLLPNTPYQSNNVVQNRKCMKSGAMTLHSVAAEYPHADAQAFQQGKKAGTWPPPAHTGWHFQNNYGNIISNDSPYMTQIHGNMGNAMQLAADKPETVFAGNPSHHQHHPAAPAAAAAAAAAPPPPPPAVGRPFIPTRKNAVRSRKPTQTSHQENQLHAGTLEDNFVAGSVGTGGGGGSGGPFPDKCPVCGHQPKGVQKRNFRGHLERHMKTHDEESKLKCTYPGCPKTIQGGRADNLRDHLRRVHHVEPDANLSECAGTTIVGTPRVGSSFETDEAREVDGWTTHAEGGTGLLDPKGLGVGDESSHGPLGDVPGNGSVLMGISGGRDSTASELQDTGSFGPLEEEDLNMVVFGAKHESLIPQATAWNASGGEPSHSYIYAAYDIL